MSAKRFSGGMTLNTPEFFQMQRDIATDVIGSHLLIAARYQNGVAIGYKFNKRQNDPRELIERINDASIVVGWGDLGHFERLCGFMRGISNEIKDLVTANYITDFPLKKDLAELFEEAISSSKPYRVSLLFIDLAEKKLTMLHFDGRKMKRSQFGVLGGYIYQDRQQLKDESEIILLKYGFSPDTMPRSPSPALSNDLDCAYERSLKNPLKNALLTLEEIYGDRDLLDTKKAAIEAVKNTLFLHDPPSKRETFEITTFENGSFESVYFTREEESGGAGTPLASQDDSKVKNELNVEVEFKPECKGCGEDCHCKDHGENDENDHEPQT